MSDQNVLFVSDRESFIIKSIIKNLEEQNLHCTFCHMKINELEKAKEKTLMMILIYIDDLAALDRMACTYLRDLYVDNDYQLFLMGHKEDIDELKEEVFISGVSGEFYRPVNANQVAVDIATAVSEEAIRMGRKHILVVDDSGTMLTTIKGWLQDKYRVTMVNSAMNAFTFLASQRPDLILLDYDMPVCSGAQFLEMLRSDVKNQDIDVIFLTGKDDAESVKRVLSLKPWGYLLKSLPKAEIVAKVDEYFQRQKF